MTLRTSSAAPGMARMKLTAMIAAALVVCEAIRPLRAHEFFYEAQLTGPAESPPNGSPAIGSVMILLDLDLITLDIDASFSGLMGAVTGAHIHAPTTTPGSGIALAATPLPSFPGFPLGVSSGSYEQTLSLVPASSYNPAFITASGGMVSDALNALTFALADGKAYFDIETTAFPNGEIRGFLTAVPEPAAGTLAIAGALGALVVHTAGRRASRRLKG